MSIMPLKSTHTLLFGFFLWTIPLSTSVKALNNAFVLGDSLSDSGNVFIATGGQVQPIPFQEDNLIPQLAYASGRFSNGPVWVEYLADSLALSAEPSLAGGTNFAFGGARTGAIDLEGVPPTPVPSLLEQQNFLLASSPEGLPSEALYVVSGGANDARIAAELHHSGKEGAASQIIQQGIGNLSKILNTLEGAGAKHFLVPNIPDLGLTPEARRASEELEEASTAVSQKFNTLLARSLKEFGSNSSVNLITLDTFALLHQIVDSPTSFGFPENFVTTEPCIGLDSVCTDPDRYLFYDGIHPTTVAHAKLAELASSEFVEASPPPTTAIPEPSTILGTVIAFGLSGFWRQKKSK